MATLGLEKGQIVFFPWNSNHGEVQKWSKSGDQKSGENVWKINRSFGGAGLYGGRPFFPEIDRCPYSFFSRHAEMLKLGDNRGWRGRGNANCRTKQWVTGSRFVGGPPPEAPGSILTFADQLTKVAPKSKRVGTRWDPRGWWWWWRWTRIKRVQVQICPRFENVTYVVSRIVRSIKIQRLFLTWYFISGSTRVCYIFI